METSFGTHKLLAVAVPLELCLAISHWQLNHVAVSSQELLILCWWGVLATESIELRFCWLHMMTMMMMMIVDLYSTLRRAPLLHYMSRCIVKRNVFSADRKDPMLSDGSRRWSGSRFQTIGPATENARRPNLLQRWQSVELTTETCCLFCDIYNYVMMFCFVGCVQGRSIWSIAVNQDETLIVSLLYRFGIITGILRVCVNSYIYVHLSVANFICQRTADSWTYCRWNFFSSALFSQMQTGKGLAQLAECRSLAGELTLSCARPAADGWPLCGYTVCYRSAN